jgi:hypothetical protein
VLKATYVPNGKHLIRNDFFASANQPETTKGNSFLVTTDFFAFSAECFG